MFQARSQPLPETTITQLGQVQTVPLRKAHTRVTVSRYEVNAGTGKAQLL